VFSPRRKPPLIPDDVREDLRSIACSLREIAGLFRKAVVGIPAKAGTIEQLRGGLTVAITGIPLGGQGQFTVTWNGALQAGATNAWSADDPSAVVTLQPDGSAIVAVPAGDTATTVNLTVSTTASNGATVTATAAVPVLPAVVVPATGGVINQIA